MVLMTEAAATLLAALRTDPVLARLTARVLLTDPRTPAGPPTTLRTELLLL